MKNTYYLLALLSTVLFATQSCRTVKHRQRKNLQTVYFQLKDSLAGSDIRFMKDSIRIIFPEHVVFQLNSAEILENFKVPLTRFVNTMKYYPGLDILITGYTDNTGEADYNYTLSKERASSAQQFLIYKGMLAPRLKTWGLGEKNPLFNNDTPENRARNRRVEFVILYADTE